MPTLLVDIDSLRPDHTGAYGYEAPTTPYIDQIAEDGLVFSNAYAANSPCMPSRAAFLSGRYGLHNGVVTHGPLAQTLRSPHNWVTSDGLAVDGRLTPIDGRSYVTRVQLIQEHLYDDVMGTTQTDRADWQPENWHTLPELFFNNRIRTGAVSSFPRHPAKWFYHLWHEFHHPQEPQGDDELFQTPRAESITDIALNFIERHSDEDFFLYAQYWEPHAPYNRPKEEVERFDDVALPPHPTNDQLQEHREWEAQFTAGQLGISNREDLRELLANYDAEIRHVDAHVGRLVRALREEGLYDETTIIVTADHGEEFGENGVYANHPNTHDTTQRVPLVIRPPADSNFASGVREHLVTNVDLAPTIADYAGLDAPAKWQGRSLRAVIESDTEDWREHLVFDHGAKCVQRAIRTEQWKLIRTYHPGAWGDYYPEYQLYDMETDPWEQENLAENRPDIVDDLEADILLWAEEHAGIDGDATRELARTGPPYAFEDPFERTYTDVT